MDRSFPVKSYRRDELLEAIDGHVVDDTELVGTFDARLSA